jgi:hypothetical protein
MKKLTFGEDLTTILFSRDQKGAYEKIRGSNYHPKRVRRRKK